MKIPLYQVDAFARSVFDGNPAAVCPLESWIYDATLQRIAAENNQPATAFIVPRDGQFEIRWFSPRKEIELCGHATLASGYVVLTDLDPRRDAVRFASHAGELGVRRQGDRLALALPRQDPSPVAPPPGLAAALGAAPRALLASGSRLLCIYDDAAEVARLSPDLAALTALGNYVVIVSAPGAGFECDFVSRFFAPAAGGEDPVTGSAHCLLVPYWAKELKRTSLFAKQISKRGGEIWCSLGEREVTLAGYVTPYLVGEIDV